MSVYRDVKGYRRVNGHTDMGKPRVPPLPQFTVMTDRTDGSLWLLTHQAEDADPENLILVLEEDPDPRPDMQTYGPYAGPFIDGRVRLFVEDGFLKAAPVLAIDTVTHSRPVFTRSGLNREFLRIDAPKGWKAGDPLVFTKITV